MTEPKATADLVTFLRARFDDDEQYARAMIDGAMRGVIGVSGSGRPDMRALSVVELWANSKVMPPTDPARVLAEVERDRRIIELHTGDHECPEIRIGTYPDDWPDAAPWGSPGAQWRHAFGEHFADKPCPTLRLLALPYVDQPGFDESWRP